MHREHLLRVHPDKRGSDAEFVEYLKKWKQLANLRGKVKGDEDGYWKRCSQFVADQYSCVSKQVKAYFSSWFREDEEDSRALVVI
jgi:hypothetical protein